MTVSAVSLEDKYTATHGRVFVNGLQALTRLPMTQIRRDRAAGLKTGAFISGYRGSPLGGFDQALQAAKGHLAHYDVVFQPGVNEDLAATAVWGSQQLHLSPAARYDGVVGIWYGKGPGVDRSGDVFKHGNAAGSARHGGVLCLAGDDHGAKSSTVPHQSDHAFMSAVMPVLYPSSIHEFIPMGLAGIAMSRYSGCWVGMKVIADTIETSSSIDLADEWKQFVTPEDFELPPGGLNLRWPDDRWSQDHRLQIYKAYAAIAFARANHIDRLVVDSRTPRMGIVASGKAYEDVRLALDKLGIDAEMADRIGLRVYKVGMPWPLEPEGIRRFSEGLEEILVVEERREIIENQIKQQLFNWRADVRPRIIGKFDHRDRPVLPLDKVLTAGQMAGVIGRWLTGLGVEEPIADRLNQRVAYYETHAARVRPAPIHRTPHFCSGCPHNTSTKVPEGSRAVGGIGCHYMVTWMDRRTETFTHMGGEGIPWVGASHFTDEKHIFANLGDGTYFHSGIMAIRQAVASGVNITYKVLYNGAVAMTGGQPLDGELSVPDLIRQLQAERVGRIALVAEQPDSYRRVDLPSGVSLHHRDELPAVMDEFRQLPGTTIIVYDQGCAAEKRRKRRRGLIEDPAVRLYIEPLVCEGCGDCSTESNCISVEPIETELGRKRRINQSSCNKDYSCLKGFCPSFVTVEGGALRRKHGASADAAEIPLPQVPDSLERPFNIAVTGIGGTGVLTIGAILGMAAHLEGKASMILDISGLAQKGGAVLTHIRLGQKVEEISSPRIIAGGADLLIAPDAVVAASEESLPLLDEGLTHAVVNTHVTPISDFIRHRDFDFRQAEVRTAIAASARPESDFADFTRLAEAVAGDAIVTNIMMVGFAFQKGLVPLSLEALNRAIELNGVSVKANQQALTWGRLLAWKPEKAWELAGLASEETAPSEMSLDQLVEHRAAYLRDYQGEALARRYRDLVGRVGQAAGRLALGEGLARAVAVNFFRLLSYKDEYEVARLFTRPEFRAGLEAQFEGDYRLSFSMAPPLISPLDKLTGRPIKRRFGGWILTVFRILAAARHLRGTPLDVFGWQAERREERQLIDQYERDIGQILSSLDRHTLAAALDLASLPSEIRGYGPVKRAAMEAAQARRAALWNEFRTPAAMDRTVRTAAE